MPIHILLADDDKDDCLLFKEVLEELPIPTHFIAVHDGEELMQLLVNNKEQLPHILFLDINIPRKNGFECLMEIKLNKELKKRHVVIFTTSCEQGTVDLLYNKGAHYYIRKPAEFLQLKNAVLKVLALIEKNPLIDPAGTVQQPSRANFVLNGDL